MTKAFLCLVTLGVLGANAAQVSPVQKVIQLIADMETKVTAEGNAAEADFAEYAKWCDGEADEKTRAIKAANEEISDLKATIADSTATITGLETKIGELAATISSTEAEAAKAKNNRESGQKAFGGAEEELVDTVSTLGHDAELIKKKMGGASLAQLPSGARAQMERMMKGLQSVVDANWVTTQEKKTVSAFLQQKSQDQDEDEQTPAAYESSSGGILDAIAGMEEKAEESLSSERKEEMKDQNAYALLKMALENELKNAKDELAKATSKKQFTTEELARAEKTLTAARSSLAEDSKYLADLKRECQAKATEFEEEYKDRVGELTALGKAKAIMTEKFAFVQTGMTVRVRSHNWLAQGSKDDRKEKALKMIATMGKRLRSTALVSLSYRALADPFAKVKNMIEEMVEKLLAEAAEEAGQKAFCDKELGESKASKAEKEGKLDTVNARIEKSESAVEKLGEEIKTISNELAEMNAANAEATKIRTEEKATFEKTAKDYSESQEACAAAIEVLRSYYESGSFVQVRATTTLKSRMKARESSGDAGGIIGMLEVAESDFSKLLSEAKAAEDAAAGEYDAMINDSKVLGATKNAELKGKKTEMASIKANLENYSDDKDGLNSELSAVVEYLEKVKPQCEYQVPSYEERKQRREKEIEGLKEALSVLSGDGI